ncbi:hypothetical protein BDQ17DRAFT_1346575 [Cyathus striatus]|nr:hypothetical protein BDQ17DRAFT_1346575 [Cyathus striatus]
MIWLFPHDMATLCPFVTTELNIAISSCVFDTVLPSQYAAPQASLPPALTLRLCPCYVRIHAIKPSIYITCPLQNILVPTSARCSRDGDFYASSSVFPSGSATAALEVYRGSGLTQRVDISQYFVVVDSQLDREHFLP